MATAADRARLRDWRPAWIEALGKARGSGAGAGIAAEGALFEYDAALTRPVPPAGRYRCRVFKLGARRAGLLDYVAYPWFACAIAGDEAAGAGERWRFAKTTGSQRQVGTILPDTATRAVFLGTLLLGEETRLIPYGRDAARDQAGWVERVGDRRWRIAFPRPQFESVVDVMELVPAD